MLTEPRGSGVMSSARAAHQPRAAYNMSDYDISSSVSGSLDVGPDEIHVKEMPTVKTDSKVDVGLPDIRVKELPVIKLKSSIKEMPLIKTDSKVDLGLDNIRVKELPRVELEFAVKPTCVHLPSHPKFCWLFFGFETCSRSRSAALRVRRSAFASTFLRPRRLRLSRSRHRRKSAAAQNEGSVRLS